jgi:hypothetical protein
MASVFIGGSRAVSRLNAVIRGQLDNLMDHKCLILIGDANGADKAVQAYLFERGYRDVVVYCMDACRNNLGQWQVRPQQSPNGGKRDFEYYSTKDRAMTRDANCGVMLWDGKSRGTLNNVTNLISDGKKVLLYFSPKRTFQKLSTMEDLHRLLQSCDKRHIDRLFRKLGMTSPFDAQQITLR